MSRTDGDGEGWRYLYDDTCPACRAGTHRPAAPAAEAGDELRDVLAESLFAFRYHLTDPGISPAERAQHWQACETKDYIRATADAVLALPELRGLVEQAAEAARLRAELQDFAVEMINHPDDSAADWGYDLAHRLGLMDGEGTDG